MTERTCEHSYLPYEGCPYCKEYRRGLEVGQSTTALAEMLDAETRACAEICEKQAQTFSTEEYAVGQPLSSFSERFACSQIKAAILARLDQRKEPTP